MDKETRQGISRYSQQIDNLEATMELIKTSTVLCFTTMDRSPEETVSIEFTEGTEGTNWIIQESIDAMVAYLTDKIADLEEKIDKLIEKGKE
jgi:prefoldin subunit 5